MTKPDSDNHSNFVKQAVQFLYNVIDECQILKDKVMAAVQGKLEGVAQVAMNAVATVVPNAKGPPDKSPSRSS